MNFIERDRKIDIVKGIGILLVVIGHINLGPNLFLNTLNRVIYSFHMPLFFFVSGRLFNQNKSLKEVLKRRGNRLIKPYIIFSIIDYIIWLILQYQRIQNGQYYYIIEPIISGTLFIRSNFNGAIWFLACIFITELIFYFIIKISKNNHYKIILIIFSLNIIGIFYKDYIKIPLPFSLDISFNMIFFYYLGYRLKNNNILNKKCNILSGVLLVVTLLITSRFNGVIDVFAEEYGHIYLLFLINSILGIIIIFKIANFIGTSRFLEFNGKNSLIILGTHQQFVIRVLAKFVKEDVSQQVVIYTFIYFIFALFISYLVILLTNKKRVLI